MLDGLLLGIGISFATRFITVFSTKVGELVVGKDIERRIAACYQKAAGLLVDQCKEEDWSEQRLEALVHVLSMPEVEDSIVMDGTRIENCGRIVDSLIGKDVKVTKNSKLPEGYKLIIGDNSEVEL